MYGLILPANAQMYMAEIQKLVDFDSLNPSVWAEKYFPDYTFEHLLLHMRLIT